MAFSRQKRALAGRLRERNSASASSVISGLDRNASIVICSLSGLDSLGTVVTVGFAFRLSTRPIGSRSIASPWPVIGCAASFVVISGAAVAVAAVSLVGRLVTASKLIGLMRELLFARARRNVATGSGVGFARPARAFICLVFSFFSSSVVLESVSAIIA